MKPSTIFCHVCGQAQVEQLVDYSTLRRITSDSKPWPNGGWLGVCPACGCAQKAADEAWYAEIEQIYDQYTIYYQGSGSEQAVFVSGEAYARSSRLVQCLLQDQWLAGTGRLLDIGCGNGALLRAFSQQQPGWTLFGTELNEKYRELVEQIPGVASFYAGQPDQVPGQFDLMTMIHVLEHIPNPGQLLNRLSTKLDSGGHILIQVPSYAANPFDLLIADHSTHFTAETASALLRRAGYHVDVIPAGWVPKELSILAHPVPKGAGPLPENIPGPAQSDTYRAVERAIYWLRDVVTAAQACSRETDFGLFGTSIAATWLFCEMDGQISFFVDEDPNRVGRLHMGKPIYHPRDLAAGALVFIPMPTPQAEKIKLRMAITYPDLRLRLPPSLKLNE